MSGGGDEDQPADVRGRRGHRLLPHTADLRLQAWAEDREQCLAEAVMGVVGHFASTAGVRAASVVAVRLTGSGEELLAGLLDEVVFRLEVHGQVPVDVEVRTAAEGGVEARLAMAALADVAIVGAVPKGVSWHGLRIGPDGSGWSCLVTVDV
jgi:SHS2 domain-containing protein